MNNKSTATSKHSGATLYRRQREPQERQRVPIGPTEAIRIRLEMNKENFSEAIGFHPSTYNGYLQKGFITKTAAMAAEALVHRHQQSFGDVVDEAYILRIINGVPTVIRIAQLQRLKISENEFLMVPIGTILP